MKTRYPLLWLLIVPACGGEAEIAAGAKAPSVPALTTASPALAATALAPAALYPYPKTRVDATVNSVQGVAIADPFQWLEDRQSADTQSWMKAEDEWTRGELRKLPERDAIAARLKALLYVDSLGVPTHRGNRYFVTRKKSTDEKGIVYVRDGKQGTDRVLLNPNEWAADGSASLGSTSASHDGRYMAYTVKANNSDEATLYVIDVATGKKLEKDAIEGAKYASASWSPSGDGFYYTWLPTDPAISPAERPGFAEVRWHKLGTDPKTDTVIRERTGDATTFVAGWTSWDGHYLFYQLQHGWTSNELFFKDLRKKGAAWTPLAAGAKGHFEATEYQDEFFVETDEGAPREHIFRVDPNHPERSHWREIVAEPKEEAIHSVGIVGGKLAITYLHNATGRLEIRDLEGKLEREVKVPGLGTVDGVSGRADEDESWFSYTSYTEPWSSYSLSMRTGATTLYSKVEVPFDASPYTTTQVFYPSKDGTKVSMFVVHRKDLKKGIPSRAMLYGYGGFQSAQTPSFNATVVPWLEHGGIYAVANLRGGSEYGEEWHQNGMLLKKQNVFDDFIGAAEFLTREGYTDASRLVISGASNGGLLVGAAMTQRPDLFGAVLCGVPLLDMVRYHQFGSGKTWVSEYGSVDNPQQFRALYAYSPYHHVQNETKYPALLMLSADSDDRVDPMHARKFVAEMQRKSTGGPVMLRIEKNSGHGGADLRKAEVEKSADRFAFALAYTKP